MSVLASMPMGGQIITPSADTRTIYVSSSTGNDANNGLSPNSAVATIAEGLSLIRDGSADHLLLKAGDTFVDQSFGWLPFSGRSGTEPILISSYGTGARPLIETPANSDLAIGALNHGTVGSNIAIIGLDFYDYTRDPSNPHYAGQGSGDQSGLFYLSNANNVLVEDTRFSFYHRKRSRRRLPPAISFLTEMYLQIIGTLTLLVILSVCMFRVSRT